MPRRINLPGANELFRPTQADADPQAPAGTPSAKARHDTKITVYLTTSQLLDLEQARLTLLAEHGITADRGRIVREATAMVLEDLQRRGADSDLVRRLEP